MAGSITLVPSNCLFCLSEFLPYIVTYSIDSGTTGAVETIIDDPALSLTPNFEKLCAYLGVRFPDVCFRPRRARGSCGDNSDDETAKQSIFQAPADRFLCLSCFEKLNNLRMLNDQLKEITSKISEATRTIKNIIMSQSSDLTACEQEVDSYSFTKSFGNHVLKITEGSPLWKAENHVMEVLLDVKEERSDEDETCGEESTELELISGESSSSVPLCQLSSEDEQDSDDGDNPIDKAEVESATRKLHIIAGSICLPKVTRAEIQVDRKQVFPCPHCEKCYGSIQYLGIHIKSQHSRRKKKGGASEEKCPLRVKSKVEIGGNTFYQCVHCKKNYEKVKALRNHISRNHPNGSASASPVVTCPQCTSYRTFKNQNLLDRHIFSMHTSGPKHKCDTCPKSFYSKQSLLQHVAAEHQGVRFLCIHCPKYFKTSALVKRHVMIAHHTEKNHKCTVCTATFVTASDLKRHAIIHDDSFTKDHICDQCGQQFLTRSRLTAHISQVHIEPEKKHKCTQCSACFSKQSNLNRHLQTHIVDRFQCSHCSVKLASTDVLESHLKRCRSKKKRKTTKTTARSRDSSEDLRI